MISYHQIISYQDSFVSVVHREIQCNTARLVYHSQNKKLFFDLYLLCKFFHSYMIKMSSMKHKFNFL